MFLQQSFQFSVLIVSTSLSPFVRRDTFVQNTGHSPTDPRAVHFESRTLSGPGLASMVRPGSVGAVMGARRARRSQSGGSTFPRRSSSQGATGRAAARAPLRTASSGTAPASSPPDVQAPAASTVKPTGLIGRVRAAFSRLCQPKRKFRPQNDDDEGLSDAEDDRS